MHKYLLRIDDRHRDGGRRWQIIAAQTAADALTIGEFELRKWGKIYTVDSEYPAMVITGIEALEDTDVVTQLQRGDYVTAGT
jgi:hypothetical protein